ncbi:hypothetical protein ES332_D07G085500v1 [Gossypium tomentosum]|uniref:Defensin-like protein n=1 Tax=Gossypium tomentosum TaxID=34277 RepID=A0A5D2K476_GOSTO|nr:hypothetical protein ES332_D07G085500v1 [Gossypium tomentosum]
MASCGIASCFVILMVAFCVLNSEACTHDSECQLNCEHLDFCDLKTGKCSCLPIFEPLPSNDAKCSKDSDCAKPCGQGCKRYNCVRGYCLCHCTA